MLEHQQKTLSRLGDFGCSGSRGGSLSESVKEQKLMTKIFFSNSVE